MDKAEEKSFETYPIENGIDNYPISRAGFIAGYHRAEKDLIDKACEWLEEHLLDFWSQRITNTDYFIEDFKQAMEE